MPNRPRYIRPPDGGGGGGGGQQGGSTVVFSKFGEVESLGAGAAIGLDCLKIGPTDNEVGVAMGLDRLSMEFDRLALGPAVALDSTKVGPFQRTEVGVGLRGELNVEGYLPADDTYLDDNASSTPQGATSPLLSRTANGLGNGEAHAYIAWDLTSFAGSTFTFIGLFFTAETSGLTSENGSVEVFTHPTRPFDEATATWDNDEQPPGTLRETIDVTFPTSYSLQGVSLNAATRNSAAGNWVYLRFSGVSALGLNTIRVRSKETADSPYLNFALDI